MLVRKNMAAVIHATGSASTDAAALRSRPPPPPRAVVVVVAVVDGEHAERRCRPGGGGVSCRSRRTATFFWRRLRNEAVCGESGLRCHAATATSTEGKPSMRKSSRQGAIGLARPTLMMTHARDEAKVVANGAAAAGQQKESHSFPP